MKSVFDCWKLIRIKNSKRYRLVLLHSMKRWKRSLNASGRSSKNRNHNYSRSALTFQRKKISLNNNYRMQLPYRNSKSRNLKQKYKFWTNRSQDFRTRYKTNASSSKMKSIALNINWTTLSVITANFKIAANVTRLFLKVNVNSLSSRGIKQRVTTWKQVASLSQLLNSFRSVEAKRKIEQKQVKARC